MMGGKCRAEDPESHRKGDGAFATAGLMIGFVLMMMMDTALA